MLTNLTSGPYFAGIDLGKHSHWVTVLDQDGSPIIDEPLRNLPRAMTDLASRLRQLTAEVRVGCDVRGGPADFLTVALNTQGIDLFHVSGLAVASARRTFPTGEFKSDRRDAMVIAQQVRIHIHWSRISIPNENDAQISLLVTQRHQLIDDQTRSISRIHKMVLSIFPELAQILDFKSKFSLLLLSKCATPEKIRSLDETELAKLHGKRRKDSTIFRKILDAACKQTLCVPGQRSTAKFVHEMCREALGRREKIIKIEKRISEILHKHHDAHLMMSLPGFGPILTAELISRIGSIKRFRSADCLASTAGIAPVGRHSGMSSYVRRPFGGNKRLKTIFYQAAFSALHTPESRRFYDRKRKEGKTHKQAVIALARRQVTVLWAVLRDQKPYRPDFKIGGM